MCLKNNRQTNDIRPSGNSPVKRAVVVLLSAIWVVCHACGQTGETYRIPFRVMEWNVENLFDTRHDTLKEDQEFLPASVRHWIYSKYRKKLTDIARVIVAAGEWTPPALIGLCEVENDSVLDDLTRYSPLKELGYRYVITQSPDTRGMDVALLYQRDVFRLLSYSSISIPPLKHARPTRDILHVSGLILTGDTLDVLICHLPSRSRGAKESEPYRLHAASLLRQLSDSLLQQRSNPKLIIMGDFNDYPSDKSIRMVLQANEIPHPVHGPHSSSRQQVVASQKLYHLLAGRTQSRDFGSYKYKGEWGLLDHLIVSGSLLDSAANFYTEGQKANVLRLPFILTEDHQYGGYEPFRTYKGMKYQGGISDHLPVYTDFELILEK